MRSFWKITAAGVAIAMLAALFWPNGAGAEGENTAGAWLERSTTRYETGTYKVQHIWVDPINGNDDRDGLSAAQCLKTLDAAWRLIHDVPTRAKAGYCINLKKGEYPEDSLPNYIEDRRASREKPIIIRAVDGEGTAILRGDLNFFDCSYVYLIDFTIAPKPAGDTLHFEKCDNILLRNLKLDGGIFTKEGQTAPVAHDNLKANQCNNIYVENCEIRGARDNCLDFVAVHGGHIVRNKIHNANDWGAYVKGGSANFEISGNEIFNCGTGGFTAGQGTGFQWMREPYLKYEAENIRVTDNYIHDCYGAGLGVNGGFNIILQNNTLMRVGNRSHMAEFVFGSRSCDGGDQQGGCTANLQKGGWGTTRTDDGDNFVRIPNKDVSFLNNVLIGDTKGPAPQFFTVFGPYDGDHQNGSNAPRPARADDNLVIKANVLWNPGETPLGIEDENAGCRDDNATCNAAQLKRENHFMRQTPAPVDATRGDFRVRL